MMCVSLKYTALSVLATAGLLLTIHLHRDGINSQGDLIEKADQIEMLIQTLEARKDESATTRIVGPTQTVDQDSDGASEDKENHIRRKRGKAKSLDRWKERLGDHEESQGKKKKKKRKKEKQRLLDKHLDETARKGDSNSRGDEDDQAPSEYDPWQGHRTVVDLNDPERLKRHRKTPLKDLPRDKYWPVVLKPSYGRFFKELNLDNYSPEDAEYLRSRLPEYRERAERVSRECSARPELLTDKMKIKTLVWDTRHSPHLVWCQLPKIASSSWNADFFFLGHSDEDPEEVEKMIGKEDYDEDSNFNLHHEVFRLFPAPNTTVLRNKVFTNALRFMVVRHPFVRLVSAYRDKITQDKPKPVWFHYEKLQKLIIDKYRPADSDVDDVHPTFPEFVSFVIDQTQGLKTKHDWRMVTCWKPYYLSCGVCTHDMQMILKLETLNEDTRFLATLAGLEQLKKKTMWRHHLNGTSSDALSLKYFEKLKKGQVEQLFQRYRTDFDLFGYSPQEYLDRAMLD